MPFAFAYVLAFCHCISEHRIRFKFSFTCGRRLATPNECRTNNTSSMLFCFWLYFQQWNLKELKFNS